MTTSVMSENSVILMTLPTERRSVSPLTPSPSREIRGIRLFRAISRKLTKRSNENLNFNRDADSRSSSSDSCESSLTKKGEKEDNSLSSRSSTIRSVSPNHLSSSSSSDAGSGDFPVRQRHHHSTSAESIRKVFQNLNLNTPRSSSCTNTKESTKRKSSKKSAPKRILRPPVTYTYVKGLSGLPTQRIPKNQARMYMNPCGCSMQYMAGLNR